MKNFTDEQLKDELANRGYCTSALWCVEDVRHTVSRYNEREGTAYEISDADAMEILEALFGVNGERSPDQELLYYWVTVHF